MGMTKKMKGFRAFSLTGVLLLNLGFTGCAPEIPEEEEPGAVLETGFEGLEKSDEDAREPLEDEGAEPGENSEESGRAFTDEELGAMGVNEMGRVMILMYHSLAEEEKNYVRSVENFREDLELLYLKGYRVISVADYIDGNIEVEAGKSPVILTFDDGTLSNFEVYEENGRLVVNPDCAVGILDDFARRHPDFGKKAMFFLFGTNPFRQFEFIDYKLNYLVENGYELGSHSFGHEDLGDLGAEGIARSLSKIDKYLTDKVPHYKIRALALPFGSRPKDQTLKDILVSGEFEGHLYGNEAIFAVGWQPERSPIHAKTDFAYLNRVHGSHEEFGIRYWLEVFENRPEDRFVSDGDPGIFTVKKEDAGAVSMERLGERALRVIE